MKYADVILPLPLENSYTYSIPSDLEQAVIPGCRVIVHFGKKRYYTAIVMDVHERGIDSQYETKEIYALLDAACAPSSATSFLEMDRILLSV